MSKNEKEVRMIALKDIPLIITKNMVWKPPVSSGKEFSITPQEGKVLYRRRLADFVTP